MKHNPFVPREQRTAILTFDNGQRVRAEINFGEATCRCENLKPRKEEEQ